VHRIVLACYGVPPSAGAAAATDITREFAEHRPWHRNVLCTWDGSRLVLEGENDFDSTGLALLDELSDCLSAYIVELFDGEIKIESATHLRK
jgi:hypothetical protein